MQPCKLCFILFDHLQTKYIFYTFKNLPIVKVTYIHYRKISNYSKLIM